MRGVKLLLGQEKMRDAGEKKPQKSKDVCKDVRAAEF